MWIYYTPVLRARLSRNCLIIITNMVSTNLFLSSLSLHHFRNYEQVRLEISAAPVVLFGHNGAGKTNILEAISLLVPGRGLRRSKLADITNVQTGQPWVVAACVHGLQGEVIIGTGRDMDAELQEKRITKIDGVSLKTQAELSEHLNILWLTPQIEQLFLEGASEGRKFLDRLVYGFDNQHASQINRYEQAMRERNRLLALGGADSSWLDAVEMTMAEKAASIASSRLMAIDHINHAVDESTLSFPKPWLAVEGLLERLLLEGKSALEAEQAFIESLKANRYQDAGAGRTLIGTHRSEFMVTHKTRNIPAALCSTGEQKALILSILLAQSRASVNWRQVTPILLLDEVVAHLDPMRRLELFDEIRTLGAQVWMTGTDHTLFEGIAEDAQLMEIKQGELLAQPCFTAA